MELSHYTVYDAVFELVRIATQLRERIDVVFDDGEVVAAEAALSAAPPSRRAIVELRLAPKD